MDPKNRQEVIRIMQSEQGFAMRPFPKGHRGLTLVANGNLDPAGEPYLEMITKEGTSAKPGDRLVLTDLKIENSKIIFDINGGPDRKHRFLRHVQIGTGPMMNPVVQGDDQDPQGSRLTLDFKGHMPELTGAQVKALLSPLISFDVKTPVQAFTDTLPPKLKDAILAHHVIVGMSTEMVLFALGQPQRKVREMEGQMPFEEWIYGAPPKDVEFVRINGNRVIRLEVAKMGEKPEIFDKDEVEGMMRTDGTPLAPADHHQDRGHGRCGAQSRHPGPRSPAQPAQGRRGLAAGPAARSSGRHEAGAVPQAEAGRLPRRQQICRADPSRTTKPISRLSPTNPRPSSRTESKSDQPERVQAGFVELRRRPRRRQPSPISA